MLFDVPNLDELDITELRSLDRIFRLLASYANCKASAMAYRASGNVQRALSLEGNCDKVYEKLKASDDIEVW